MPRPFTDVLRDHRNGRLVDHLTDQLALVLAGVRDTGQKGSITLTLEISPERGEEGFVDVQPKVSTKVPQPPLSKGLFYVDEGGSLLRDPPRGGALFNPAEVESDAPRKASEG